LDCSNQVVVSKEWKGVVLQPKCFIRAASLNFQVTHAFEEVPSLMTEEDNLWLQFNLVNPSFSIFLCFEKSRPKNPHGRPHSRSHQSSLSPFFKRDPQELSQVGEERLFEKLAGLRELLSEIQ
jgi:hypothetical protein